MPKKIYNDCMEVQQTSFSIFNNKKKVEYDDDGNPVTFYQHGVDLKFALLDEDEYIIPYSKDKKNILLFKTNALINVSEWAIKFSENKYKINEALTNLKNKFTNQET